MNFSNFVLRCPVSIASRFRKAWFRLLGVRFTGRADLRRISIPRNPWDIAIGAAALDDGVVLITTGPRRAEPRIVIGDNLYINRYTVIDASEKVEIENGVMIGPHCYITDHDHGTSGHGSVGALALVSSPTRIGRNAWLGAHVTVLKGVTVGEGAVVGAGAVVTKDVPAGAIVAGVPAKIIGWRKGEAESNV